MHRISIQLKNEILNCLSRKKTARFILPNLLGKLDENTKWCNVINLDERSLSCFLEHWQNLGMDPFINEFEAKACYKIFFMFFHEALPELDRNSPYIRIIDIKERYGQLQIPSVDFNDPQIIEKITSWLDEI